MAGKRKPSLFLHGRISRFLGNTAVCLSVHFGFHLAGKRPVMPAHNFQERPSLRLYLIFFPCSSITAGTKVLYISTKEPFSDLFSHAEPYTCRIFGKLPNLESEVRALFFALQCVSQSATTSATNFRTKKSFFPEQQKTPLGLPLRKEDEEKLQPAPAVITCRKQAFFFHSSLFLPRRIVLETRILFPGARGRKGREMT